ncbi:serine carboxypeptidase II-2, partial [Trifolium medium]|nr:serine carboxypeptidase II-2 [Trifolium medium]
ANILFIDSPIGVGFSYSNDSSDILNNGDKRTAEDNLIFILKWFERFPQYKETNFFIIGESYAGHYVPQLSQVIVKYNSATKQDSINLKGYMVGNALTDDFHDQLGMFQFMWSNGMISDQTFKLLNLLCDFESVEHPSESCEKMWEIAYNELGNIDPYSIFTATCHANINQPAKRKHYMFWKTRDPVSVFM